jgi:hypothetical protein
MQSNQSLEHQSLICPWQPGKEGTSETETYNAHHCLTHSPFPSDHLIPCFSFFPQHTLVYSSNQFPAILDTYKTYPSSLKDPPTHSLSRYLSFSYPASTSSSYHISRCSLHHTSCLFWHSLSASLPSSSPTSHTLLISGKRQAWPTTFSLDDKSLLLDHMHPIFMHAMLLILFKSSRGLPPTQAKLLPHGHSISLPSDPKRRCTAEECSTTTSLQGEDNVVTTLNVEISTTVAQRSTFATRNSTKESTALATLLARAPTALKSQIPVRARNRLDQSATEMTAPALLATAPLDHRLASQQPATVKAASAIQDAKDP